MGSMQILGAQWYGGAHAMEFSFWSFREGGLGAYTELPQRKAKADSSRLGPRLGPPHGVSSAAAPLLKAKQLVYLCITRNQTLLPVNSITCTDELGRGMVTDSSNHLLGTYSLPYLHVYRKSGDPKQNETTPQQRGRGQSCGQTPPFFLPPGPHLFPDSPARRFSGRSTDRKKKLLCLIKGGLPVNGPCQ